MGGTSGHSRGVSWAVSIVLLAAPVIAAGGGCKKESETIRKDMDRVCGWAGEIQADPAVATADKVEALLTRIHAESVSGGVRHLMEAFGVSAETDRMRLLGLGLEEKDVADWSCPALEAMVEGKLRLLRDDIARVCGWAGEIEGDAAIPPERKAQALRERLAGASGTYILEMVDLLLKDDRDGATRSIELSNDLRQFGDAETSCPALERILLGPAAAE